jgi:hypothetical protein
MAGSRRRSRIESLVHMLRLSGGCDTFGDFATCGAFAESGFAMWRRSLPPVDAGVSASEDVT